MKIIAYIDAFNFYYGLTKGTSYKWCNLLLLCQNLFPEGEIVKVKVFAAFSKEFPGNPGQSKRQNSYFRALETIPQIEIIKGKYSIADKFLPLSEPKEGELKNVKVKVSKEKGSDVNLATHLLLDAFKNSFDMAAVFTNDSDLAEPIRAVRHEFSKQVYLLLTCRGGNRPASKQLMTYANYHKQVTEEMLEASRLPDRILTPKGNVITIPENWKTKIK
jgi:hypothetical protein